MVSFLMMLRSLGLAAILPTWLLKTILRPLELATPLNPSAKQTISFSQLVAVLLMVVLSPFAKPVMALFVNFGKLSLVVFLQLLMDMPSVMICLLSVRVALAGIGLPSTARGLVRTWVRL